MMTTQLDRIYHLVGRIALSWNEVDLLWYLLFTFVMKDTPRKQVDTIFHIFQTGASQRSLTMAVVGTFDEKDQLRIRLGQLNAKTNDAAGRRNAAVHALLVDIPKTVLVESKIKVVGFDFRVSPGVNPNKINKLSGKDVDLELMSILAEIESLIAALDGYLRELTPKIEADPSMIAALTELGLQVPFYLVPRESDPQKTAEAEPPQQ